MEKGKRDLKGLLTAPATRGGVVSCGNHPGQWSPENAEQAPGTPRGAQTALILQGVRDTFMEGLSGTRGGHSATGAPCCGSIRVPAEAGLGIHSPLSPRLGAARLLGFSSGHARWPLQPGTGVNLGVLCPQRAGKGLNVPAL